MCDYCVNARSDNQRNTSKFGGGHRHTGGRHYVRCHDDDVVLSPATQQGQKRDGITVGTPSGVADSKRSEGALNGDEIPGGFAPTDWRCRPVDFTGSPRAPTVEAGDRLVVGACIRLRYRLLVVGSASVGSLAAVGGSGVPGVGTSSSHLHMADGDSRLKQQI
jgi:hypothetical protein